MSSVGYSGNRELPLAVKVIVPTGMLGGGVSRRQVRAGIAKGARAIVLASDDPKVENSFDEPTKVVPVTRLLEEAGSDFVYDSPGYSVSILRLKTTR